MRRILARGLILAAICVVAPALAAVFVLRNLLPAVHPVGILFGSFVLLFLIWYLGARWKAVVMPEPGNRPSRVAQLAASIPVILTAIATLALFRSILVEPVSATGRSMEPTIMGGDHLLISKPSYGYSRYSFPFELMPISGRILGSQPERGDLVVYRDPGDNSRNTISRVIGIPRDRVRMIKGHPYINGEAVKREQIDNTTLVLDGKAMPVRQWRETLFNGVSYRIYDIIDDGPFDDMPEQNVPPNHYFLMSDNRDSAADSRYSGIGPVPFENLIGRIVFCLHSACSR